MRRATAALIAVALLATAACERAHAPAPDRSPASSGAQRPASYRARTAEDGGSVKVVEQGFTATTSRTGRPLVSYGFVLQNTSRTRVARNTVVNVSLKTADGKAVTDYIISPNRTIVASLRPGGRFGVGWNSRVDGYGTTVVAVRVRSVLWTRLDAAQPVDGHDVPPAELTAAGVSVAPAGPGLAADVAFTVHSGYAQVLSHIWADVLYRNAAGRIVGGTNSRLSGRWITSSYAPGDSPGRMTDLIGPPATADLSRTDVFLYPDPA